jgi:hypothetical protein
MKRRMRMKVTAELFMGVRSDLAQHLLRAAAQAARTTYDIEIAGDAKTTGPGFDEIMRSVPVSVIMSAAVLEASSNELIQDVLDGKVRLGLLTEAKKYS